jgi:IS5 family transposase
MQMSFGTLELAERLKRDNVLMKIDALIEVGGVTSEA